MMKAILLVATRKKRVLLIIIVTRKTKRIGNAQKESLGKILFRILKRNKILFSILLFNKILERIKTRILKLDIKIFNRIPVCNPI